MTTSKDDTTSRQEKLDRDMADAFRSMRDDAVRIALGETKLQLDLSPEGELAKMTEQAGPVVPLPFQVQLEMEEREDLKPALKAKKIEEAYFEWLKDIELHGAYAPRPPVQRRELDKMVRTLRKQAQKMAKEAATRETDSKATNAEKERVRRAWLNNYYDPLYPIPRRELAKAVATLRELTQLQGKSATWGRDSSIGQTIQELTVLFNYQAMKLPNEPEQLRLIVAIYLAMKCQTCSALVYSRNAEQLGRRIILAEHEASMARLKSDEAREKEKLYALLGYTTKIKEARLLADEENDKSWQWSKEAANLKNNNAGSVEQSRQMSEEGSQNQSDVDKKTLAIKQQEAFCAWRKYLSENNEKLLPKKLIRYKHFKEVWVAKTGSVVWGQIVMTINLDRFSTLWESYEKALHRHSSKHFPAPK